MNIIHSKTLHGEVVNMDRVRELVRERVTEEQRVEAAAEDKAARQTHAEAAKVDRSRNGWSGKKKDWRRIAQVKTRHMREFRQMADANDWKSMKAFIVENGYHTVERNSF